MTFRSGWVPTPADRPRARITAALNEGTAPPTASYSQVPVVGMHLNDQWGCCVLACDANIVQQQSFYGQGSEVTVPDQAVLTAYEVVGGFNPGAGPPGSNRTDNGAQVPDGLSYLKKTGMCGVTIAGYGEVDGTQVEKLKTAIAEFGAMSIGINLPNSAIRQFNAGRGWSLAANDGGNAGGHCLCPGTRVLTEDLRWVLIEDVVPGDALVGFDEHSQHPQKRKFRRSVVEARTTYELPCYELEFEDGTVVRASEDHLWFVFDGKHMKWLRTDQMRQRGPGGSYGSKVWKIASVWEEDSSRDAGYLAAAFDGEGWLEKDNGRASRVGFAQKNNAMWERVIHALKERGFTYRCGDAVGGFDGSGEVQHLVINADSGQAVRREGSGGSLREGADRRRGRGELLRFLGSVRPHRLLSKFSPELLGSVYGHPNALVRKTFIGQQTVVALQTSTRTFVAEGLASHNCVCVAGYDDTGFQLWTWDRLITMTYAFAARYVEEWWAVVSHDWVNAATGKDPEGVDLAVLGAEFQAETGHNPFPVPSPPPAPAPPGPSPTPAPAPSPVRPTPCGMIRRFLRKVPWR